ncbi:MAG: hypothetical protein R2734_18355 [Nocardioides sp.]
MASHSTRGEDSAAGGGSIVLPTGAAGTEPHDGVTQIVEVFEVEGLDGGGHLVDMVLEEVQSVRHGGIATESAGPEPCVFVTVVGVDVSVLDRDGLGLEFDGVADDVLEHGVTRQPVLPASAILRVGGVEVEYCTAAPSSASQYSNMRNPWMLRRDVTRARHPALAGVAPLLARAMTLLQQAILPGASAYSAT